MKFAWKALTGLGLGLVFGTAHAQHLWWKAPESARGATCLYGEVTVLQSGPTIYFCGCNWWPGGAAGGYTGIQEQGDGRHNMIFSIWDTSSELHPGVMQQNELTKSNRFGGEGTGAHTHLDYAWPPRKTYQYFAVKKQDKTGQNTLCTVFFYDLATKKWVNEATITSPNNGEAPVKTFGGGLNSFLENWSGQDKTRTKLAIYRLWLGLDPAHLESVNDGAGDGKWGTLNDYFYLAEGTDNGVQDAVAHEASRSAVMQTGTKGSTLHITNRPIGHGLSRQLAQLYKEAPGV